MPVARSVLAAAATTASDAPQSRAVVLGASLAGLLAARVLSAHVDEVVLLERDVLPEGPAARKGTPHALQPHGLLARGLQVLEQLFPGYTDALVAQGAALGDLQAGAVFSANRRPFATGVAGAPAMGVSRLAIEAEVRRRVLALRNVRLLSNVDVLAPECREGRVVAARYRSRDGDAAMPDEAPVQSLPATLVVDCTGRGSQAPRWLEAWGFDAPREERVEIGICYTSGYFVAEGACARGPGLDKVATFGAVTNEQPRPGVLLAQEPGADGRARWVAGVGGFKGDHCAGTLEALRERARDIGGPELLHVVTHGEPIGDVMRYQMPFSQRRRYESLKRRPQGFVVMGDAITSFNPIYGQGMTVAACEALALDAAMRAGTKDLERRFHRAAARVVDVPWQLAVGGDLSIDLVPGARPLPVRIVNAYIGRLYKVAPDDAVVSAAFQKVVHMVAPPASLFALPILRRVLWPKAKKQGSLAFAR